MEWIALYILPIFPTAYFCGVYARRNADTETWWIMAAVVWPIFIFFVLLVEGGSRMAPAVVSVFDRASLAIDRASLALDHALERITAREIDRDEFGILYESPWPYNSLRVRVVDPGTGAVHWIRVAREFRADMRPRQERRPVLPITTAKAAVASSYGLYEDEYNPVRV